MCINIVKLIITDVYGYRYGGEDFVRDDNGVWSSEYIRAELAGVDLSGTSNQGDWVNKLEGISPSTDVDVLCVQHLKTAL